MPTLVKFTRRQFLCCLSILCLLLIICAWVVYNGFNFSQRQRAFWHKYEEIQEDMTREEVEEILGPPDLELRFDDREICLHFVHNPTKEELEGIHGSPDRELLPCGHDLCHWFDGERTIVVSFRRGWGEDMEWKKSYPETPRERLDELLGK